MKEMLQKNLKISRWLAPEEKGCTVIKKREFFFLEYPIEVDFQKKYKIDLQTYFLCGVESTKCWPLASIFTGLFQYSGCAPGQKE